MDDKNAAYLRIYKQDTNQWRHIRVLRPNFDDVNLTDVENAKLKAAEIKEQG